MNVSRLCIVSLFLPLLVGPQAWGALPSFQTLDGSGWPTAISADGSVVVGKRETEHKPGGALWEYYYEGVRWDNGVVTSLGDLPGGDPDGGAYGVSADGSVIVGYGHSDAGQEAVMWNNGVVTSLGILTGYDTSVAYGVSADGTVVAGSALANGSSINLTGDAWRWDGGAMTALGLGVGSTFEAVQVNAVSADGSVVVGYRGGTWGSASFRWDSGVLTTLGSLWARGVSADGSVVVGGSGFEGGPWRWVDGVTTVGNAAKELDGMPRLATGWIAHIPEPVSLSLLFLGAFGLPRRRRRR